MITYLKKYPIVKNGFSLLEMLIVVSIVLVLATIAVPKFSSAGDKARDAKIHTDMRTISNAASLYKFEQGSFPSTVKDLSDKDYLEFEPKPPKGADAYELSNGVVTVTIDGKTYRSDSLDTTKS